jgi:hypothetical protein
VIFMQMMRGSFRWGILKERPLGIPRPKWEGNNKMYLKIRWVGMELIHLARDSHR